MKDIPNQIMLITYPDSLGGDLPGLRRALARHFDGAVGSLHILPFFPSSGDRGFSPTTYEQVDPAFGGWEDIKALARTYPLMCDMMVNHISRHSREFEDFQRKGAESPYADMFLDYERFFGGEPSPQEMAKLYRRSDKPLYVDEPVAGGRRRLWCTFSSEQLDLNTDSPVTRAYLARSLRALGERGVSLVRMDAYGYITKVRGTNCFFVEPKIWELIGELDGQLARQGMTLLPEVHDSYETALKIAAHGYYTYDFVLPLLTLHTLLTADARAMKRWFSICPRRQFTVLDTHDGVGVFDADGIVSREQAEEVIRRIEPRLSYAYKPLDPSRRKNWRSYQLYGTYYSMLGEDDALYLLARAIQFFAPGIPQVYYVGMLAGRNDLSFPEDDHRFINRHNYPEAEIEAQTRRDIVQRLLSLMRLRNRHPAFGGELEVLPSPDDALFLRRRSGGEEATLKVDLTRRSFELRYSENGRMRLWQA